MSYNLTKPPLQLAPYIKQYWSIENTLGAGESHVQRIVPTGLIELSFYLADHPKTEASNRCFKGNSLISGQQESYFDLQTCGKLDLFSVTFQPQAARLFFDLPITELYNQTIPLEYLGKETFSQIESELYAAKTFPQKVTVMNRFLSERLKQNFHQNSLGRLSSVFSLINNLKGQVTIDVLARQACLSRKQFERVFASGVGVSPKRFLRIVRFQNALHQRQLNQKIRLTNLAYDCGYFDQPHMINDFKLLSGMSPGEYFSKCCPESDYFQS